MRRPITLTTFACASALVLALAGCNSSSSTSDSGTAGSTSAGSEVTSTQGDETESADAAEEAKTPTYSPSEFSIGNFDVTITSATTEYSEWDEVDALVFTLEVTNTSDVADDFGDTLNLASITQGDEEIYWAYEVVDAEDTWQYAAIGSYEDLEPGDSAEYTYGFLLEGYDDPVVIDFSTYSEGVEGGAEVTFDVSGCESDAAKAAAEAAEAEAAQRAEDLANAPTTLTIAGATVDLPDGWYFDYIADNYYSSIARDVDDTCEVDFNRADNYASAQEWAEAKASNWSSVTVEERDGGYYDEVGETTWYLYLDTSEGPIEIMGYKISYADAADVLAGVTIN